MMTADDEEKEQEEKMVGTVDTTCKVDENNTGGQDADDALDDSDAVTERLQGSCRGPGHRGIAVILAGITPNDIEQHDVSSIGGSCSGPGHRGGDLEIGGTKINNDDVGLHISGHCRNTSDAEIGHRRVESVNSISSNKQVRGGVVVSPTTNTQQRSSRIGDVYALNPKNKFVMREPGQRGTGQEQAPESATENDINKNNKDGKSPITEDNLEGIDATWGDVYSACLCHNREEWTKTIGFFVTLLFLLYSFLLGLDLLGTSFKVVGGCAAGSMLGGSDVNPIASVMIGIIATAILQSSSTTTAIIVSLVSGGLDVKQAIYMVMGANVGTTITCMLVSLAHITSGEEIERAFAGSSMYFIFNFFTIIILFPLEVLTGYLYKLTKVMLPDSLQKGDSWEGPIKKIVNPVVKRIIIANKGLIEGISTGEYESCQVFYPVQCNGGVVSYETCKDTAGLIACDKHTGKCPAFFDIGASQQDDIVSGWVCLIIALFLLIICLIGLVTLLRKVLLGASTRLLYKATNINDILAMFIGTGVTMLVQSSSITTSTLVPLTGVGILRLEKMYPLILGADIGTTITALLAAMVSSKIESLQVALVHLFFNVTGILIWYPLPFLRNTVFRFARLLGAITSHWRSFPVLFICFMFLILPIVLFGLSSCFDKHTKGFTALGIFLVFLIASAVAYFVVWWKCWKGKEKFKKWIDRRRRHSAALANLADELDYIKVDAEWCKNEIGRIKDFAGVAIQRMEEGGRYKKTDDEEGPFDTAHDQEDNVSLYGSIQSAPWKNVLCSAAGSFKSGLGSVK